MSPQGRIDPGPLEWKPQDATFLPIVTGKSCAPDTADTLYVTLAVAASLTKIGPRVKVRNMQYLHVPMKLPCIVSNIFLIFR